LKVKEYLEEIYEDSASNEEKCLKKAFNNITICPEEKVTKDKPANEIEKQNQQNTNIKIKLKRIRVFIAITISILSITFGIGDYYGWWDHLSGRSDVLVSHDRLSSAKVDPGIFIYDSEKVFHNLYSFIIKRTQKQTLKKLHKKNIKPEFLVRTSRTAGQKSKNKLQTDYSAAHISPDSLPILFAYNFSGEKHKAVRVCLLSDLTRWVEESRNQERLIFFITIVSVLSITIAVVDIFT